MWWLRRRRTGRDHGLGVACGKVFAIVLTVPL
jgi:hypothetical protein